jgi:hypothetical protein
MRLRSFFFAALRMPHAPSLRRSQSTAPEQPPSASSQLLHRCYAAHSSHRVPFGVCAPQCEWTPSARFQNVSPTRRLASALYCPLLVSTPYIPVCAPAYRVTTCVCLVRCTALARYVHRSWTTLWGNSPASSSSRRSSKTPAGRTAASRQTTCRCYP